MTDNQSQHKYTLAGLMHGLWNQPAFSGEKSTIPQAGEDTYWNQKFTNCTEEGSNKTFCFLGNIIPRSPSFDVSFWRSPTSRIDFSDLSPLAINDPNANNSSLYEKARDYKHLFLDTIENMTGIGDQQSILQRGILSMEGFLDCTQYAWHIMSTKEFGFNYRDHYVHPVIVAGIGIKWLHLPHKNDSKVPLYKEAATHVKAQLDRAGLLEIVDESLNRLKGTVTWDDFIGFTWVISALFHDHGRALLTLTKFSALNDSIVAGGGESVDIERLKPVFRSLEKTCVGEFPFQSAENRKNFLNTTENLTSIEDIRSRITDRLNKLQQLGSIIWGKEIDQKNEIVSLGWVPEIVYRIREAGDILDIVIKPEMVFLLSHAKKKPDFGDAGHVVSHKPQHETKPAATSEVEQLPVDGFLGGATNKHIFSLKAGRLSAERSCPTFWTGSTRGTAFIRIRNR